MPSPTVSAHLARRLSVRLAPVTTRAADVAPVAPACCNVCRTCTATNLVGIAFGAAAVIAAAPGRVLGRVRAPRESNGLS